MSNAGEYSVHRDLTIFVIRLILLFDEQMKLQVRHCRVLKQERKKHLRQQTFKWILPQHSNPTEPIPQLAEHRISLTPLVVQFQQVYVELKVVTKPQ